MYYQPVQQVSTNTLVAMLLYDDEQISVWCETPECNTRGQAAACVLCCVRVGSHP